MPSSQGKKTVLADKMPFCFVGTSKITCQISVEAAMLAVRRFYSDFTVRPLDLKFLHCFHVERLTLGRGEKSVACDNHRF